MPNPKLPSFGFRVYRVEGFLTLVFTVNLELAIGRLLQQSRANSDSYGAKPRMLKQNQG